ncbi:ABC transporter B family member 11-like [Dorcoceras hygrometricum]|uniref:ABC transporter B family member 11-like n=1 Tax=Dorcoceras hygrometricum TaxID=472368 RepID=A0A2Z7CIE1_9LAMI|nr:ABC transporter B family member 11-like [Dorcoceras hygrometricum]
MAASFFVNALQVDFESVLTMEHAGMAKIFIAGTVVSFVANRKLAFTKEVFAEAFGLPTEVQVGFLDISTQTVMDMRSRCSGSDVPFREPIKKKEMKMEYRLFHDIVAKSRCAKAAGGDKESTAGGPEATMEMTPEVEKQADDTSNASEQEERVECEKETEKEGQDGNVSTISQGEHVESTTEDETGAGNRETFMEARNEKAQPAQQSTTNTDESFYAPVELREINWVSYWLPVEQDSVYEVCGRFVKTENKLFSWAETDKVSELLQRRDLVWYKMVEFHMREAVAEHWKNFHKDKPSANQDIMAIRMLEAELAKTRKSVNLFQAKAGLPVTYNERSTDRVGSFEIIPILTWEEYKAQRVQPTHSTPDKRTN